MRKRGSLKARLGRCSYLVSDMEITNKSPELLEIASNMHTRALTLVNNAEMAVASLEVYLATLSDIERKKAR